MIARRVSKPNICRLRILHCLCQHGCEPEIFMFPRLPCVCIHLECGQRSRCTDIMRARTCVSVVVCVARKLRPCPSYSRRRDRNNSVHWRSLYKGGGGTWGPWLVWKALMYWQRDKTETALCVPDVRSEAAGWAATHGRDVKKKRTHLSPLIMSLRLSIYSSRTPLPCCRSARFAAPIQHPQSVTCKRPLCTCWAMGQSLTPTSNSRQLSGEVKR